MRTMSVFFLNKRCYAMTLIAMYYILSPLFKLMVTTAKQVSLL